MPPGFFPRSTALSNVREFIGRSQGLVCEPLLPLIAEQAAKADSTRSVDPPVIQAIKQTDLMRLSATRNISGVEASISTIARELEAIAGCCASTAWCLWNHLCVFHFICAQLGLAGAETLKRIVAAREWVSFPAGAGTSVHGRAVGDQIIIDGRASFASGSRYGEWAACLFALEPETPQPGAKPDLRFTVVRTDAPGVSIDPTWFSMSLRASVAPHLIVCREVVQKMRVQQLFSVAKQPASRENNRGPYPGILSQSGVSCQGSERQRQQW